MSREIKFRVWDKALKIMRETSPYIPSMSDRHWSTLIEGGNIALRFNIHLENHAYKNCIDDQNFELMQFTGLKDKNGKEIWEGDVIHGRQHDVYEVVFEHGCFGVWREGFTYDGTLIMQRDICEVIGNIYENPELLS